MVYRGDFQILTLHRLLPVSVEIAANNHSRHTMGQQTGGVIIQQSSFTHVVDSVHALPKAMPTGRHPHPTSAVRGDS